MTGTGVPVHWLDGGWEDRPTLVANSNAEFYGSDVGEHRLWRLCHRELRLIVRRSHRTMVWTGCDEILESRIRISPWCNTSSMDMVAVGITT